MKSLRNRIVLTLFLVSAIMVLALSLYTGVVMGSTSTFLRQDIQERLLAESFSAALIIAPEELQQLQVPQDMDTPLYQELKGRLINFAEEHSVVYVYYIRLTPSGDCQFIIDNDTTEDTVSLATPSIPTEAAVASAFAGTPKTTDFESYSEGYSGLLSSYSPVYDQEGTVIAVAGVDISDHQILEVNRQTSTLTILLIMSIALVIFTGIGNVVLQMRKERELERQLDQQELMSSISQGFISQQSMQDLIIASLRQTGEFLGVERVLVAIASKDSDETRPMYAWVSEDRFVPDPAQEGFGGIIASTFPKTMPRNGMVPTLFCNDVRHDYNEKFTVFMKAGLRSFIWAPLYVDGSYWGLLSIEECGKKRTWTESEAQLVGTVSGAIANAVARDLIEKERVEALDHAIQAGQAKSDFLSNMSHEMRTPMNAIIGMTTIAQDAEDLERKDYCLSKIEEASSHLLGIINDVLDMSKIEANRLELAHTPFRFEQVVKKTIDIMSLKTLEKRQALRVFMDKNIPPVLVGDDQRLAQVITNLLSNANKFTPEDGSIDMHAKVLDVTDNVCTLRIKVRDTGIGISAEQQARLFTSFAQAESGTSRKFGGTGLGLAISKRIVELMGGQIWIESKLGEGATFVFTVKMLVGGEDALPPEPHLLAATAPFATVDADVEGTTETGEAKGGSSGDAGDAGGAENVGNTEGGSAPEGALDTDDGGIAGIFEGYCVLLAEDMEINREIVLALLEPTLLAIECAENGAEALQMFVDDPARYDLILMDMQMPEMDGLEATRSLRALEVPEAKAIPIVAMTANVFREDVEKCLEVGMNDHVGKPLDLDEVIAKLRGYLLLKR